MKFFYLLPVLLSGCSYLSLEVYTVNEVGSKDKGFHLLSNSVEKVAESIGSLGYQVVRRSTTDDVSNYYYIHDENSFDPFYIILFKKNEDTDSYVIFVNPRNGLGFDVRDRDRIQKVLDLLLIDKEAQILSRSMGKRILKQVDEWSNQEE